MAGENLAKEFLAVNPRGIVPTPELDDGTVIDEAPAICGYIEALHPEPALLGRTPLERALVQSRERHMEFDGMLRLAEFFRNGMPALAERGLPGQSGDATIPALVERGRRGVGIFYERFEAELARTEFLAGGYFSLADITALCVVDFARSIGFEIPGSNTRTREWHASVSSRLSAGA